MSVGLTAGVLGVLLCFHLLMQRVRREKIIEAKIIFALQLA